MIQAICWVLIHSLWQGLLFTVATGLVMLATVKKTAVIRYRWLCVLFGLFLALCVGTFIYEWRLNQGLVDEAMGLTGEARSNMLGVMNGYFSEHASLIVLVWFVVFLVKCVRMTGSLIWSQRIRYYGVSAVSESWQLWMQEWCERLDIRKKVSLLESRIVKMPMVTGFWRPVVFLPFGLLTQLPSKEIEAILLHELAHIRRHDWLVNFLQHIAENIFFFNPALLWMSALLRAEREHCCDDLAIAGIDGDRVQFVQALVHFKEYNMRAQGLAMGWAQRKGQLVQRVMRIAGHPNEPLSIAEKFFFIVSMVVVMLLTLATGRHGGDQITGHGNALTLDNKIAVRWAEAGPSIMELKEILRQEPTKEPATASHPVATSVKKAKAAAVVTTVVKSMECIESLEQTQTEIARVQSDRDRLQADKDREQARLDRMQADKDREQADRDREQAVRDRAQADRDRVQAEKDRAQAAKDLAQAVKDREQAARDRDQAMRDRQQNRQ